ncbi:hypothetical protein GCM10007904_14070 [Oharaeibacter diazotrophicus]|nr:hypothetical protein GCM10007904_14070 [Oharaeibacter diazotrophicus]
MTQALRAHFGTAEDVVGSPDPALRARNVARLVRGEIFGGAWTEVGTAVQSGFSTTVRPVDGRLALTGRKYYTTGSLYADWIDVGASDADGRDVGVIVPAGAPGVEIVDDWDGFGQTLTASGTGIFTGVSVDPADVVLSEEKLRYGAAFYQLVHLATIAGIGRAIARDVAAAVAERRRSFTNAAAARPAEDPQVLQVVGEIRGRAYSAGAIVLKAAEAVELAARTRRGGDIAADDEANLLAELETAQAQNTVIDLVVASAGRLFDALGASSTRQGLALDRHWRNARTLASHNPRIYKERIVGDYAVNGTPPPYQWRIGLPG